MPGVSFQRSPAHSRLFISTASLSNWSAFLLSDQSTFNGNKIDLTACWRERGAAFIFSHKAPAALNQAYVDALWQVILAKTPQFLWNALVFLQEPDAAPTAENVWVLPITQPFTLQFRVHENTVLPIGNGLVELKFRKDTQVSIQILGDKSAIKFEFPNAHPVEVLIQGKPVTNQTTREALLPLTSPACGCFLFGMHLTPDDQLVNIDLGLKYFFGKENSQELHYPVFLPGPEKSGVFFDAAIDPTALLNPERTFLAFTGETRRLTTLGESTTTVFDTPFRTLKGYGIRLKPEKELARLVFSRRNAGAPYYFVPAGDFEVEILPQAGKTGLVNGTAKWLVGFAGTETIRFPYEPGKVLLRFHPHQPAFATDFPAQPSTHTNRLQLAAPLADHCQTAWLSLRRRDGKPVHFISQPDGGPLYKPDAEDLDTPVFDYLDTTFELPGDGVFCLPIIPHIPGPHAAEELNFENQILSPARKQAVDAIRKTLPPAQQIVQSTTPQGNLVKLQPQGNNWTELLLGEDASAQQLRFDLPPLPLQKAFQTNQQFLVVTNATNLGSFQNELSIAGWPFSFNAGQNQRLGDYSNVLIFKFCNESVLERIQNPSLWTQPKDFNGAKSVNPSDLELQLISRWLQDYIGDAIQNQSENPYFQDFIRLVQNPRWNGVLALKTDILPDGLPAELQGLVGGIDLSRFNAHHVGMEINQVKNQGGELTYKEKSSLFGLVYYEDPARRSSAPAGAVRRSSAKAGKFPSETFDFRVLTLLAQFKNSALQQFSSKIRVTMRELFGEKVVPGSTDHIILDGTHEKKNGKDVYTFLSETPVQFQVESALYQEIEIDRAVFLTHPRAEGSREVHAGFSFIGNLLFDIPQAGFDLLSFGKTEGRAEANPGLAFSNLQLGFSFNLDHPTLRTFSMNYPTVRFNLANSPLREGSLLHQLPLELKSFKFGNPDTPPGKQGYLPVELAGLETAGISGDWYGLECILHMGSAGGLSNLGNLAAPVLLAWGTGSKTGSPKLFMGIKLPGANPEAKMLSIQGLLKLNIDRIQLVSSPNGFILKLDDISLKFFGLAKIPPGGSTAFYLFGNPEGGNKDIGWYAAYNKEPQA